jgi:hypothetical protein
VEALVAGGCQVAVAVVVALEFPLARVDLADL